MNILIGLVIAFIIIVAVFVGYSYSQKPVEVGGHDFPIDSEIVSQNTKSIQILSNIESILSR
ncbi:MAG: hypothetical protein HOK63_00745 [Thaumarchaeota archaeon]|nr:hypothetical protein [Nitrososphaerota archaeon]MBT5842638.1 hypothetical protein [Nitrososphaerota archaeon]MBT6468168.1 hypothetical protein [Nitrososphaerota archaeon]